MLINCQANKEPNVFQSISEREITQRRRFQLFEIDLPKEKLPQGINMSAYNNGPKKEDQKVIISKVRKVGIGCSSFTHTPFLSLFVFVSSAAQTQSEWDTYSSHLCVNNGFWYFRV